MITISDLALQYSGTFLFQHVDLQFTAGNCYGVIGANGAGKSTFLKLLSGELDSTKGTISIKPGLRMSVLKQDQHCVYPGMVYISYPTEFGTLYTKRELVELASVCRLVQGGDKT